MLVDNGKLLEEPQMNSYQRRGQLQLKHMMRVIFGGELWKQYVQLRLHVYSLLPPYLRSFRLFAHKLQLSHDALNVDVKLLLGLPMVILPKHPGNVVHYHLHFTLFLLLFLLLGLNPIHLTSGHFQYLESSPGKGYGRYYSVSDMLDEMCNHLIADFR
ncbi:hypothetical protein FGO68_gene5196 [Halteria grandinella]|uniref:Uncharacterized protein n=1 Tax=Halteria grandinella TaxID=5974 RepID=A0A8J8NXJ1_HALGN|nr:hypothetical protein FGO68_gene5196 [Halteria grandinella]